MKSYTIAVSGLIIAAVLSPFLALTAFAQTTSPAGTIACPAISHDLYRGVVNTTEVNSLQAYLFARAYFSAQTVGPFGPMTFRAVTQFQRDNGVPATGYVGPLTRAAIMRLCAPPTSTVSIQSISPTSGPVGTQVTLTGRFLSDNNIVHFGGGAITGVRVASSIAIACTTDPSCIPGIRQALVFTVPSSVGPYCKSGMMCPMYMQLITPGAYQVYVENENGTSNSVQFTVTGSTGTGGPLSVTGLDAPSSLSLGTSGTWTVHATTNTGAGNLHYSVVWGDEVYASTASIRDPGTVDIQTSATFSHAYAHSGTYTPTFTIADDAGHSVTTSTTVVVTPLY